MHKLRWLLGLKQEVDQSCSPGLVQLAAHMLGSNQMSSIQQMSFRAGAAADTGHKISRIRIDVRLEVLDLR